jgi:hypothetical protein
VDKVLVRSGSVAAQAPSLTSVSFFSCASGSRHPLPASTYHSIAWSECPRRGLPEIGLMPTHGPVIAMAFCSMEHAPYLSRSIGMRPP